MIIKVLVMIIQKKKNWSYVVFTEAFLILAFYNYE